MRVQDRVALVTGGAVGIGAATCLRLAEEGAAVAVTDVNIDGAEEVAGRIKEKGGRAFAMHQDVTDEGQWKTIVDEVVSRFGKLNILVNNAGIGIIADVEAETLEGWNRTIDVNLNAVFLGCREAIRAMKEAGSGSIVNISSIEGMIGWSIIPAYNASKGGVRILTKSVALHCCEKGYNIRVNSIHPGFIETAMVDNIGKQVTPELAAELTAKVGSMIPMGHMGEAVDIANGVLYLASDESKFMTGSELVIDGGHTAQ
ncbi:MAG: glucose 1-dehydrogenase [Pseudomonadota bacterium]